MAGSSMSHSFPKDLHPRHGDLTDGARRDDNSSPGPRRHINGRRVWKNFAAVGMAIAQQRCTRLYIHPTRLRGVIGVCNYPDLSKTISEVVIVGKLAAPLALSTPYKSRPNAYESDLISSAHPTPWPGQYYRTPTPPKPPTHAELYLNHHAWPSTALAHPLNMPQYASQKRYSEEGLFVHKYKSLITALHKLENLNAITYTEDVSKEGLCRVTNDTVETHAQFVSSFHHFGEEANSASCRPLRWTDTEVLVGVSMACRRPIMNLKIEQPLPLCEYARWPLTMELQNYHKSYDKGMASFHSKLGQSITHCTVAITGSVECCMFVRRSLDCMKNLRSLVLLYTPHREQGTDREIALRKARSLDLADRSTLLASFMQAFPSLDMLEHLEIRGAEDCTHIPPVEYLEQILGAQKKSLRRVRFSNVFFTHSNRHWDYGGATRYVLDFLKTRLALEKAEFRVPRLRSSSEVLYGNEWAVARAFEGVAQQLGVSLDEDGYWDFAQGKQADICLGRR